MELTENLEPDPQQVPVHELVRPAWAEIDLGSLAHNYREIVRLVGEKTKIIAAVKANAYGHGVVEVSRVLAGLGATALATASYDEALMVRKAGVAVPIVLFPGYLPEAIPKLLDDDLIPTVHDWDSARAVIQAATRPVTVFVEVDAGAARLGVPLDEARSLVLSLSAVENVNIDGIYAHLSFSNAQGEAWAAGQMRRYRDLIDSLEADGCLISTTGTLSSSGILAGFEVDGTSVAVGNLLYGLSPIRNAPESFSRFRPVMRAIKSRLISMSRHGASGRMGHGGVIAVDEGSVTGTAAMGRSDGLQLVADGTGEALVRGIRVPILGLSLENLVLDLSKVPNARSGDEVVLLGTSGKNEVNLDELATRRRASHVDVLVGLNRNLKRVYV